MATEREKTLVARLQRLDDLRDVRFDDMHEIIVLNRDHIKDISDIRADYERQLRLKESERIDAIRAVDVQAVQRAAEVSAIQAQTLATQVQASAETLRTQVATTAIAQTTALAAALEPIQKDISELRKTQYEQQGVKAQQLENRTTDVQDRGSSQWGIGLAVTIVVVVITTIISVAMAVLLR